MKRRFGRKKISAGLRHFLARAHMLPPMYSSRAEKSNVKTPSNARHAEMPWASRPKFEPPNPLVGPHVPSEPLSPAPDRNGGAPLGWRQKK